MIAWSGLTVCVTCVWAGVDNAWEQEKLEARKMLENAAESHTSGARFVIFFLAYRMLRFQFQCEVLSCLLPFYRYDNTLLVSHLQDFGLWRVISHTSDKFRH
jgi:hypothetical protein